MKFNELLQDGELSGYFPGTPGRNPRSLVDGPDIDGVISTETPCPECGGQMAYKPYTATENSKQGRIGDGEREHLSRFISYRAFAVCTVCGEALEF